MNDVSPTHAPPRPIRFGREICGDLTQAERREWWLANGLGGYAAGTIAGSLNRRYHGLLVAPLYPPLGRVLLLAKADATLVDGGETWPLFTNRWPGGVIEPAGHVHIESFHLDGRLPVWRYRVGDITLEKRIWMERGKNTTHIAWRRLAGGAERPLLLRVSLLVSARDHHAVSRPGPLPEVVAHGASMIVRQAEGSTLRLHAANGEMLAEPVWVENFHLPLEEERGLEHLDTHLCAGQAILVLNDEQWCGITASCEKDAAADLPASLAKARRHESALIAHTQNTVSVFRDAPEWIRQLLLAADSFVFARPLADAPEGESVIAGYPWFGDWGRDTMIALPGLTLATGRHDSARRILETFARFVDGGMLPNVFPGAGEAAAYNTADAALWYIEAWRAYVQASDDTHALARVFPLLESIIAAHLAGTRYRIHVDKADGLLYAGEPGVQLTWMDAKVGDWVVTPRIGKPVEINALWFNALQAMRAFAARLGKDTSRYQSLSKQARRSFGRFVRDDGMGLLDVIDGPDGRHDDSIRPNQIFAVSLPYSPLHATMQQQVVAVCAAKLLTSYGLRSLAADHADYRSHYLGGVWERDGAYHQGTVWAWLLGHYALAEYRTSGDAQLALSRLEPLADHLHDAGLGTISEIFDADPPHTPRGAPCQAWSVACVLEAWWRIKLGDSLTEG